MRIYLGTHIPSWLNDSEAPLFISRRRLMNIKHRWPQARTGWVLDSGGYTELATHGRWSITPAQYAREVHRYQEAIGNLEWCAPMDWMCEPSVRQKTGLTVLQHQYHTIENYAELLLEHGLPVIPVLQGWQLGDFIRHLEMYRDAGYDLTLEPLVAVGSVCRRHQDHDIVRILDRLAREGLRMHAFGVRSTALERVADFLVSSDSMAWSFAARHEKTPPDHTHPRGAKNCANCRIYAERWHSRQEARLNHGRLEVYT